MTETDYAKAKIPMLPNVYGRERTKREIIYYTSVLVAASLAALSAARHGRVLFRALRPCLAAIFLLDAIRTWREQAGTLASAPALSLLAALPRADVRGDGDRPHRHRESSALDARAGRLRRRARSERALAGTAGAGPRLRRANQRSGVGLHALPARDGALDRAREHARRPLRTPAGLSRLHRAFRGRQHRRDRRAELRRLSAGARDPSARCRRNLSGRDRDDRRRRARGAARRRARDRRRDVGTRGGHRPELRRPRHALHLVALDICSERAAGRGRLRARSARRPGRRAAQARARSTSADWCCSASVCSA